MLGVAIVGAASLTGNPSPPASPDSASEKEGTVSPLVGVCLVLVAQIFTASQFVLEERIMEVHSTSPLLSAGYEGFFGFLTTAVAFLVAYKLYGSTPAGQGGYFDVVAGYHQIVDHPPVWGSSLVIAVSIALFNFCGLAVTRTYVNFAHVLPFLLAIGTDLPFTSLATTAFPPRPVPRSTPAARSVSGQSHSLSAGRRSSSSRSSGAFLPFTSPNQY